MTKAQVETDNKIELFIIILARLILNPTQKENNLMNFQIEYRKI